MRDDAHYETNHVTIDTGDVTQNFSDVTFPFQKHPGISNRPGFGVFWGFWELLRRSRLNDDTLVNYCCQTAHCCGSYCGFVNGLKTCIENINVFYLYFVDL